MKKNTADISNDLFRMGDAEYRRFTSKLMPTVPFEKVIGVRTPLLRGYAKEMDLSLAKEFLENLPHTYYEENNLHAFLLERINDYDECVAELDRFLPYIDNWATCDMMRPKVLGKHKDLLLEDIKRWLKSNDVYAIRFAIEMLMVHFLEDAFSEEYPHLVASVKSEEYYIKMMQAWYFATALAKQYSSAVRYLEEELLDPWVHNKTISKACESFRVSEERKTYFKSLRKK